MARIWSEASHSGFVDLAANHLTLLSTSLCLKEGQQQSWVSGYLMRFWGCPRGWACVCTRACTAWVPLFLFNFYLFIYFWLCWVFVSVRGLSPVAASGGHPSPRCAGPSLSRPLLLRSTGSRRAGSVIVAHGPSCSAACGIFPDQGSNPCPVHWQADSQPLRHQGSPPSLSYLPTSPAPGGATCGLPCFGRWRQEEGERVLTTSRLGAVC